MLVSGKPQFFHISFGKILILVPDIFRGINKRNGWLPAHGMESRATRSRKVRAFPVPRLYSPLSGLFLHQKHDHIHHILHIDKVPGLFSVTKIGMMGTEQFHSPGLPDLIKGMENHRGHSPLMILIGTIYIEEFQSGPEEGLSSPAPAPSGQNHSCFVHRDSGAADLGTISWESTKPCSPSP